MPGCGDYRRCDCKLFEPWTRLDGRSPLLRSAFETILTQLTTSRLGYKLMIVLMSSEEISHDISALMDRPAYRGRAR
jgi:hypothetical protein